MLATRIPECRFTCERFSVRDSPWKRIFLWIKKIIKLKTLVHSHTDSRANVYRHSVEDDVFLFSFCFRFCSYPFESEKTQKWQKLVCPIGAKRLSAINQRLISGILARSPRTRLVIVYNSRRLFYQSFSLRLRLTYF